MNFVFLSLTFRGHPWIEMWRKHTWILHLNVGYTFLWTRKLSDLFFDTGVANNEHDNENSDIKRCDYLNYILRDTHKFLPSKLIKTIVALINVGENRIDQTRPDRGQGLVLNIRARLKEISDNQINISMYTYIFLKIFLGWPYCGVPGKGDRGQGHYKPSQIKQILVSYHAIKSNKIKY